MKKHWAQRNQSNRFIACGIFYDFLYPIPIARRKADITCGNCKRILRAKKRKK